MLKHLKTFTGHSNPIYALANSSKNGIVFSAGNDPGIVEWSLKKLAFIMVKWPVKSAVYSLHAYTHHLFAGEKTGIVTGYDFLQQKVIANFKAHEKAVFDLHVLPNLQQLITASEDGTIAVWSLKDFSLIKRIPVTDTVVRNIAVNLSETELSVGAKDHAIRIYSLPDFTLKNTLTAHSAPITALTYSKNGEYLISGSRDASLKIWNALTFQLEETVPAHLFAIYKIAFHPTRPLFATASQDKNIKIWDSNTFKLVKTLNIEKSGFGHTHSINSLLWSNEGEYLISAGDDRQVIVWEFS